MRRRDRLFGIIEILRRSKRPISGQSIGDKLGVTKRMVYRASTQTGRVIWPILLGYRDAGRIPAAWCALRQGFRYFRTERIVRGEALAQRIPRRMDLLKAEWQRAMAAERQRFGSG